ncbi:MAG TPA: AbrB/MazE/SpoVT family DNA-binding domain-containing protein [Bacillota bacterium]|nr:AbrB/MazE/SpoVT family DNA-binding domain-containing protein [Bacillota bacterium]
MKRKVFTQPGAPNRLMTSVKVGPKGQIVIPKEAREMFGIESGTVLMLLADTERGIAINTMEHFNAVAEEIFSRTTQSKDTVFASMIKKVGDNSDE